MQVRIHDLIEKTRANGPGTRFAIYFQGCNFNCFQCINPQTHDPTKGILTSTELLLTKIKDTQEFIEGITFTGGEPLLQKDAVIEIGSIARDWNLTTLLSTGYELDELKQNSGLFQRLNEIFDVIIAGRYHHEARIATGMVGSFNKTIIFNTTKYDLKDIVTARKMEIEIVPQGIRAAGTGIHGIIDWSTF